jgi:flagellin
MTVRINTNIAAMKVAHSMNDADRRLADSLERLSSGFRINRGGDNPAGLVISERMRGQIAGITQAVANTELASTMVQTAEGALGEINYILIRMRELALHANNEGGNDIQAANVDNEDIRAGVEAISRIAMSTQYGSRRLLDGSSGVSGEAQGVGLAYLGASQQTRTSPITGYEVLVTQVPTRAILEGRARLTAATLPGLSITLIEGGKTVQVRATPQDSPASFVGKLKVALAQEGMPLDVAFDGQRLSVQQREFGSKPTFHAASSVAGVLSREAGVLQAALPGQDIQGMLGGEAAHGEGLVLKGLPGSENTDGLAVRYTGPLVPSPIVGLDGERALEPRPGKGVVGVVTVANNAVNFQIGPNAGQRLGVAMPNASPQYLARSVQTESGFRALSDIDVTTRRGARDSVRLIDAAIDETSLMRGRMGALQKNTLDSNINTLRVTAENLTAAESVIRDTDVAQELAEYTKNRIKLESSAALLAQANQSSATVLQLLR